MTRIIWGVSKVAMLHMVFIGNSMSLGNVPVTTGDQDQMAYVGASHLCRGSPVTGVQAPLVTGLLLHTWLAPTYAI